jgi:hypothetical protein
MPPVPTAHPWPLKPFDRQHPVRGLLGDPRIGDQGGKSFHFGVDVAALDGTEVYAVNPGRISLDGENITVVEVEGEREHSYWHVVPVVRDGSHVVRGALLGHIAAGWGHVHLAERRGDAYWNPLRPGAMTPYEDYGDPVISQIVTSAPADNLSGQIDLIVEAFDHPPLSPPQPEWHDMPQTPALVQWRLVRDAEEFVPWRVVFDFRASFVADVQGTPPSDVNYDRLFAPGTDQNHPNQPGLYRFWLAQGFDTSAYPDGDYRLDVHASDTRGNTQLGQRVLTFTNDN